MKIIQVYSAPTSIHNDEKVKRFYEDISVALQPDERKYTILLGDFNAKLGDKLDGSEVALGAYGYGERHDRGDVLLNFFLYHKLQCINSFFTKNNWNKWTWLSLNDVTKNNIDL